MLGTGQLIAAEGRRMRNRQQIGVAFLLLLAAGAAAAQPAPAGPKMPAAPPVQAVPAEQPFRVGGAVTRPKLISQGAKPVYTEAARKARLTGVVILESVIDQQGDVTETRVLKGLPMGLDQAAVEAVETWKFEPATFEGKPVKVYYVLTVNFQLGGRAYQGPLFSKFLLAHPGFDEALRLERYDGAAALLADAPGDPGTGLARVYLLLYQGRLAEAWQAVRGQAGPTLNELSELNELNERSVRNEALHAITAFALQQSRDSDRDDAAQDAALALGLEVADVAIDADPDAFGVIRIKGQLLREKAEQTLDETERQKLLAEADRLQARAAAERTPPR